MEERFREIRLETLFSARPHRVEGEVHGFNEPALRTFDAAGFTREGARRQAYDRHGPGRTASVSACSSTIDDR